MTPKSEPATAKVKEEEGDQDSEDLREELRRRMDEFPPHDSEDSLEPELNTWQVSRDGSPRNSQGKRPQPREHFGKSNGPHAPRGSGRYRG